ncbi:MAG: molybdenum cofactor guanylyltransferase [Halobacteriota archaeon]
MTRTPERAGVVLAGGKSTRFTGDDKALATLDGRPMIRHVVEAVEPAVDEVVVNCRPTQRSTFETVLDGVDVTFAEDPITDRGPVAGLRTGLRSTDAEYAAVLACDMPFVTAALLSFLFSEARNRTGAISGSDGRFRPFPSVVHVRAASVDCTDAIVEGEGRLHDFFDLLAPRVVPDREVRAFTGVVDPFENLDSRAALWRARSRV